MREYSKTSSDFWTGETGRKIIGLGPKHVTCYLHLISSQHSNMIGLYWLPVEYVSTDTGISIKDCQQIFSDFQKIGFAFFDSNMVWVREMCKIQLGKRLKKTNKQIKHAVAILLKQKRGKLFSQFVDKYKDLLGLNGKEFHCSITDGSVIDHCSIGDRSEAVSEAVTGTGSVTGTEAEKESAPPALALVHEIKPEIKNLTDDINAVVAHYLLRYPKRHIQAKAKWATDLIRARLEEGRSVQDICTAIDVVAASVWHRENGHDDLDVILRKKKFDGRLSAAENLPAAKEAAAKKKRQEELEKRRLEYEREAAEDEALRIKQADPEYQRNRDEMWNNAMKKLGIDTSKIVRAI